jgi:hypothetical protein
VIDLAEFVERVCKLGSDRGPRAFPKRRRDRSILMKSIALELDSTREYSEPEINELLMRWQRDIAPAIDTDHVALRRYLVDYGHLERTADGSRYRLGFPQQPQIFDLDVEILDLRATTAAYRESMQTHRAAARARAMKRE